MKVTVKKLPKSEVELTITVPHDAYLKGEKKALEKLGKEIKVDGFREGHVPEAVVREKVTKEGLMGAALDFLLPQTYSAAVQQEKLQVVGSPKVDIEKTIEKEGDSLVYTATVAVMPEVKVGNYKKIKVKKPEVKVEEKQVQEAIDMILDRFAEWKDVKRKSKKGDRVETDFEGFDEEGKAIPNTASKNHPIILGSGTMIPGFEDEITGMGIGENKEFDITFPDKYHAQAMQGKKVKFKVTVNRIEERLDQVLDEDLIKKLTGQEQNVDDFKKRVEDDLKTELTSRTQREHDQKVVDEIIKIVKIELPQVMIDDEINRLMEDQKAQASRQGLTWDQYLQHIKKTEADFKKDHQKVAEDRLKASFGVQHIIKDAEIKVEDKAVDDKIEELLKRYPQEQQKSARDYYKKGSEGYERLRNSLAADMLINMLSA